MAKSYSDEVNVRIFESIKQRIPWLLIGLLGGILAFKIVSVFESTLSNNLILAAFIPLIVYMSDAVGTQMEAFVIRDFALHSKIRFTKYFIKHLITTTFIALILSLLLFIIILVFQVDFWVGVVLAISLFFSTLSSVITGLILPRFFEKIKLDPADASGPVGTIIQDILSVTIYFFIASALL